VVSKGVEETSTAGVVLDPASAVPVAKLSVMTVEAFRMTAGFSAGRLHAEIKSVNKDIEMIYKARLRKLATITNHGTSRERIASSNFSAN
jgi:hypothetical protein